MENNNTVKIKHQREGIFIYTNNTGVASTYRIIQLKI